MSERLSRAETEALIMRAQAGDDGALEAVVTDNLPLVRFIAGKFGSRGSREDLVQTGSIGLIKAVRRFDAGLGLCFSTYAVPLVAGEIKRSLRDGGIIKLGRRLNELAARIDGALREAEREGLPPPRAAELAEAFSCAPSDIAAALEAVKPCFSLDAEELAPVIRDPADVEDEAADRLMLRELVSRLPVREREVIELRYYNDLTQKEAAIRLGLTQVCVSRAEKRALKLLRSLAGEEKAL